MFHLYLTALADLYEKDFVYSLIQKGYTVYPADGQIITLQTSKTSAALLSLQVNKETAVNAEMVFDEVANLLQEIGAKYHSLIVTAYTYNAKWRSSNFETATENKLLN